MRICMLVGEVWFFFSTGVLCKHLFACLSFQCSVSQESLREQTLLLTVILLWHPISAWEWWQTCLKLQKSLSLEPGKRDILVSNCSGITDLKDWICQANNRFNWPKGWTWYENTENQLKKTTIINPLYKTSLLRSNFKLHFVVRFIFIHVYGGGERWKVRERDQEQAVILTTDIMLWLQYVIHICNNNTDNKMVLIMMTMKSCDTVTSSCVITIIIKVVVMRMMAASVSHDPSSGSIHCNYGSLWGE